MLSLKLEEKFENPNADKCLKAQNNSTREGSAPAAEDGRAATASSLGSHSRGTSLRRNL